MDWHLEAMSTNDKTQIRFFVYSQRGALVRCEKDLFQHGEKVSFCSALISSVVSVAAHSDERAFVTFLNYPS